MKYYDFYMHFDVHGEERNRLVQAIQEYSGADIEELDNGVSRIDYFHVDKDGTVWFDARADSEEIEGLIEALAAAGFECQSSETRTSEE